MGRKTKTYKKHQKFYKMKGCSKKTRKKYLGGSRSISSGDINLAYPSTNVPSVPNPFLAYTGKGGACNDSLTPSLNIPLNVGGQDKTMPSTGPLQRDLGIDFLNPQGSQHGGGCGCGGTIFGGSKKGKRGGCGPMCLAPLLMLGGKYGGKQSGGNPGISYPNGRAGDAWSSNPSHWPGVDGIQGGRNYLALNTYNNDISRQMKDVGAQPPFLGGGRRSRKYRNKKQKGGALSNFMGQDLINLGRQFQFGVGSAYNAVAGYAAPVNPLPWKGQLPNISNLNTVRSASM
jgi:hypothetical protein